MSEFDTPPPAPPSRETDRWLEPGQSNLQVVYILYLAGFVIGISVIIGLVIAYINRGRLGGWVDTHYTWQIRTFWISFLGGLVSIPFLFVGIGFLFILAIAVWVVIRCVVGLQAAGRGDAIANPQSWLV